MLTNTEAADWRRCEGTVSAVGSGAGPRIAGRLLCGPRPGLHPGDQAPANQESISMCMINRR